MAKKISSVVKLCFDLKLTSRKHFNDELAGLLVSGPEMATGLALLVVKRGRWCLVFCIFWATVRCSSMPEIVSYASNGL